MPARRRRRRPSSPTTSSRAASTHPPDPPALRRASGLRTPNAELGTQILFLGVDVGRDHDLTVFWVLRAGRGRLLHPRRSSASRARPSTLRKRALFAWLERPQVTPLLHRRHRHRAPVLPSALSSASDSYRVERVTFTGPVKEELAYPVRAAFEDRSLRIPSDPFIRADLRAIRKEATLSGNIRFTADRGKNGHADRFWALALALHAGKKRRSCGEIIVFDDAFNRALAERRNPDSTFY